MPYYEGCSYRFEELALIPGLAAYAWGEADIEIDSTGAWYIDTISLETVDGFQRLDERRADTDSAQLAEIVRNALIRTDRHKIAEACTQDGARFSHRIAAE